MVVLRQNFSVPSSPSTVHDQLLPLVMRVVLNDLESLPLNNNVHFFLFIFKHLRLLKKCV